MSYKTVKKENRVYVQLENGTLYTIEQFGSLYRRRRDLDEARSEYTKPRRWYHAHVASRDVPNSKAARADYSDGGNAVSHMVNALDGKYHDVGTGIKIPTVWGVQIGDKWYYRCFVGKSNCARIASKLMLLHWKGVGKFVASVWRYGSEGRDLTMFDFGISQATYYRRIENYASILHFSGRC